MKNIYNILFLLTVWVCLISCGKSGRVGQDSESKGETIIETGELAAINTRSFTLSRYGNWWEMRIIGILEHGTIVEEGDSIIQLDPTEVKKFIIDKETELETQQANLEKLQVEQSNRTMELESAIKTQRAMFNLKQIELEASRFESERYRRIKELEFEQAKITMAKEEQKLELNKIIQEADLKTQQVRVEQLEREIVNAYEILPQLTVRTPVAGVFQIAFSWRSNGLLKVGDNIYVGNSMANVPVLKWMKVNTYINETDFLKIYEGQKVSVRLDAMPQIVFDGEISYIGKLCHPREPNSRQKVFDVEVRILEPDERLKPGMTVSCEFLDSKSI